MHGRDYVLPDDVLGLARRCSPTGCCPASRRSMSGRTTASILDGIVARAGARGDPCVRPSSGLTVRGRAFLAAGITAVVCAILLGQPPLTRVGVLVLALPLVTAYCLGRSRYRLALVRSVAPQTVTAGQPARCSLTMTNEGRTPTGVLMLEDHVPYVLGTRPRFVLDGIGQAGAATRRTRCGPTSAAGTRSAR